MSEELRTLAIYVLGLELQVEGETVVAVFDDALSGEEIQQRYGPNGLPEPIKRWVMHTPEGIKLAFGAPILHGPAWRMYPAGPDHPRPATSIDQAVRYLRRRQRERRSDIVAEDE